MLEPYIEIGFSPHAWRCEVCGFSAKLCCVAKDLNLLAMPLLKAHAGEVVAIHFECHGGHKQNIVLQMEVAN